jgi:beta-lactamase regulating signal transducer with metallopeptidase domain
MNHDYILSHFSVYLLPIVNWLGNYWIHSSILLLFALAIEKSGIVKRFSHLEVVWRIALYGGVISASLVMLVDVMNGSSTKLITQIASPSVVATSNHSQSAFLLPVQSLIEKPETQLNNEIPTITRNKLIEGLDTSSLLKMALTPLQINLISLLVLIWLIWGASLLILKWTHIQKINQAVRHIPVINTSQLSLWCSNAKHMGLMQSQIKLSEIWQSPFVTPNSTICLPTWAIKELSLVQRESMLLHEIAHVKRRDPIWRIAGLLTTKLFTFQFLNQYAHGRLMQLSEFSCDQYAVQESRHHEALAQAIYTSSQRQVTQLNIPTQMNLALVSHLINSPIVERIRVLMQEPQLYLQRASTFQVGIKITIMLTSLALVFLLLPLLSPLFEVHAHTRNNLLSPKVIKSDAMSIPQFSVTLRTPESNEQNENALLKTEVLTEALAIEEAKDFKSIPKRTSYLQAVSDVDVNTQTTMDDLHRKLIVSVATPLQAASDFASLEKGIQAFEKQDMETALGIFKTLAERGDPKAQFYYAQMLWNSRTSNQAEQAEKWYRLSAKAGNPVAISFTATLNVRQQSLQQIHFFTQEYEGEPLKFERNNCKGLNEKAIDQMNSASNMNNFYLKRLQTLFSNCHKAYVEHLNQKIQPDQLLSKEILVAMTPFELNVLNVRLSQIGQRLVDDANNYFDQLSRKIAMLNMQHTYLKQDQDLIQGRYWDRGNRGSNALDRPISEVPNGAISEVQVIK